MKSRVLFVAATLLCSNLAWAGADTATLRGVADQRYLQVVKDENSFNPSNELLIKVRLTGANLSKARQIGNIKISKATDDLGTDLAKAPADAMVFGGAEMEDINWDFGGDKKDHQWLDIDLRIPASPARKASSIRKVEASVDLITGGEEKILEIADLPKHFGETLNDPSLKALNVSITLKKPAADSTNEVPMDIKGDPTLVKIEIVDAKGERISNGASWNDENGVRSISYSVESKLPADAKIKMTCWPGQKRVTVPITLSDIKLP